MPAEQSDNLSQGRRCGTWNLHERILEPHACANAGEYQQYVQQYVQYNRDMAVTARDNSKVETGGCVGELSEVSSS